jgi:hypothetical protein
MYWLTFFFNGKLLNTRSWNDVLVALRNVRTFYRELPIWIVGISRLTFYGGSCWVMNNDDRVMRQIIIYANFCAIESYVSDFMMLSCNFFLVYYTNCEHKFWNVCLGECVATWRDLLIPYRLADLPWRARISLSAFSSHLFSLIKKSFSLFYFQQILKQCSWIVSNEHFCPIAILTYETNKIIYYPNDGVLSAFEYW